MKNNNRLSYKNRPIGSLDALARTLRLTLDELLSIASRTDSLYRLVKCIPKKDGSVRRVYEALEPLKRIQSAINHRILKKIDYPNYLMGGIADPLKRRGHIRNAHGHAGSAVLIGEDIENFYPSVSRQAVADAFRHVLHLPSSVADMLACLCTRQGALVQGASTSTYIANLILHRREPELVSALAEKGLHYTRYIDDVHVSSRKHVPVQQVSASVRKIRAMMECEGLKPKRTKQFVAARGQKMKVHNLNVTSKASIPLEKRRGVRAGIHQLEKRAALGELRREDPQLLDQLTGQVAQIRILHPKEAARLMARLSTVRPVIRQQASVGR